MELPVKVIPSEEKPQDKRIKLIKYDLPKIPSNIFLLGRCGSGKSSALYTLLNDGYVVKGKSIFDEIVIFLGTLDSVETFKKLPCKNIVVIHEYNVDEFKAYIDDLKQHQMERLEKKKRPLNVCVVFDDFVGNNLVNAKNGQSSALEKLVITSRHECSATIIFCSQTFKHKSFTNPMVRNNINYYLLFTMARNDIEKVAEEHSNDLTKDEFLGMYREINKKPFQFMMIDYKKMCFRRGFSDIVHSFHETENKEHNQNEKKEE